VLHVLASVIACAFAVAVTLGLLALLVWLLRVILRDFAGRPGLRALMLIMSALPGPQPEEVRGHGESRIPPRPSLP
jgi:hypothetical protein